MKNIELDRYFTDLIAEGLVTPGTVGRLHTDEGMLVTVRDWSGRPCSVEAFDLVEAAEMIGERLRARRAEELAAV